MQGPAPLGAPLNMPGAPAGVPVSMIGSAGKSLQRLLGQVMIGGGMLAPPVPPMGVPPLPPVPAVAPPLPLTDEPLLTPAQPSAVSRPSSTRCLRVDDFMVALLRFA